MEIVRRDNFEFSKNCMEYCLNTFLIEDNPFKAYKYVRKMIANLFLEKLDLSMLIISKALDNLEGYRKKFPHTEVADKMYARDKINAPRIGDRVP